MRYQKERNIKHNNEIKQRKRVIKWYENILENVQKSVENQLKKYIQKHQIDVSKCKTKTIKRQINNVKEFQRKLELTPKEDIRRYFIVNN